LLLKLTALFVLVLPQLQAMSKQRLAAKTLIRELCGFAPYEKRIMELLRNSFDKRALRVAKRKVWRSLRLHCIIESCESCAISLSLSLSLSLRVRQVLPRCCLHCVSLVFSAYFVDWLAQPWQAKERGIASDHPTTKDLALSWLSNTACLFINTSL
jgi:hypothetical protein